jgi:hypothetical protein
MEKYGHLPVKKDVGREGKLGGASEMEANSGSQAVDELLSMIHPHDIKKPDTTEKTKRFIMSRERFGARGERVLLELARYPSPDRRLWSDSNSPGYKLLTIMLKNQELSCFFTRLPSKRQGWDEMSDKLPIQLAIDKQNAVFLKCFLDICDEAAKSANSGPSNFMPAKVLGASQDDRKQNCVHYAILAKHSCATRMVQVCSTEVLLQQDSQGDTPLHLAMGMKRDVEAEALVRPGEAGVGPNIRRPITPAPTDRRFLPDALIEKIEERTDADEVLPKLLTTVNKLGESPYLQRRKIASINDDEKILRKKLKDLIFQRVKGIREVSRALYGTQGWLLALSSMP